MQMHESHESSSTGLLDGELYAAPIVSDDFPELGGRGCDADSHKVLCMHSEIERELARTCCVTSQAAITPQHTLLLHTATTHSPHNLAVVVLDAGSRCLRAQLLDAFRLNSSEAHHSLAEGDAQIIPWPIASMEVADARAA